MKSLSISQFTEDCAYPFMYKTIFSAFTILRLQLTHTLSKQRSIFILYEARIKVFRIFLSHKTEP